MEIAFTREEEFDRDDHDPSFPLVSILIPTYNRPYYLELALQSVLNQTYRNIEIIISDDSTNEETKRMILPYLQKHKNIKYFHNKSPLVAANFQKCLEYASGEYINYLMDDDLFHERKIEKMLPYLLQGNDIAFVTSFRELIDDEGNLLPVQGFNQKISEDNIVLEKTMLTNFTVKHLRNIIGEPTTVLFRRSFLSGKFGEYKGRTYATLNDLATWLNLLQKGNAVYLSEALSYFRQHREQNQKNAKYILKAVSEWSYLVMSTRSERVLNEEKGFKKALLKQLQNSVSLLEIGVEQRGWTYMREAEITEAISELLEKIQTPDPHECMYCNHAFMQFVHRNEKQDSSTCSNTKDIHDSICPVCSSSVYERLCRLYIERETDLLQTSSSILHMSKDQQLKNWLLSLSNILYISEDTQSYNGQPLGLDITTALTEKEMFNVVLCSGIPDDQNVTNELYEVLKQSTLGIMQPMNVSNNIFTQQEFIEELQRKGFIVETYNFAERYGEAESTRYGLSPIDLLYVVRKE